MNVASRMDSCGVLNRLQVCVECANNSKLVHHRTKKSHLNSIPMSVELLMIGQTKGGKSDVRRAHASSQVIPSL